MIISIASGKGGTGKTTIATSLALAVSNIQFIDCDVEEPNSRIFLKPTIENSQEVNILFPEVDIESCTFCGKCAEFCQFNAISVLEDNVLIFKELCHYCGGCKIVCPNDAISESKRSIGKIEMGNLNGIEFIDGALTVSYPTPTPVIKQMKSYISKELDTIIDSPPGTACPMVESVENSDFCILVTEPTPFGLNDLKLAIDVAEKMNIRYGVIINQSDIGDNKVKEFCSKKGIEILLEIPYSRKIAEGYSRGENLISVIPEYESKFKNLYKKIQKIINSERVSSY